MEKMEVGETLYSFLLCEAEQLECVQHSITPLFRPICMFKSKRIQKLGILFKNGENIHDPENLSITS